MKKFAVLALVTILLLGLLPIVKGQDKVTLVIWGEPGTVGCITDPSSTWEFCNYVRALNDQWQEMHPDIELQWEDHGWDVDLYTALLEAIEAGNAPDITVGESFMPQMLQAGQLAPINFTDEEKENLLTAPVRAVSNDDGIHGVAAFTAVFTLEVNADVFLLAGLDPNSTDLSTWDGVSQAAATITEAGAGEFYGFSILGPTPAPVASMFRFAPYLYQTGADFCEMPTCDTPTFNDPKGVQTYEWFRELYQYTPPDLVFNGDEGVVFSQLFSGVTAMQTAGSWHPTWALGSGCENCIYLPLPLPGGGEPANVVVGNAIYATLSTSQHPEEAEMFLKWIINDDMQNNLFWTDVGGRLPTTQSGIALVQQVIDGDTSTVPAFYTDVLGKNLEDAPAEAALFQVFIDELVSGSARILPPWANHALELNVLWNEMFKDVLTSDRPVSDILDEYQAKAEEIVAQ